MGRAWAVVAVAWALAGCGGGGVGGHEDVPRATFADYTAPSYVIDVPRERGDATTRPTASCPTGHDRCDGMFTCRPLGADRAHCGSCDTACTMREDCVGGVCTLLPAGWGFCDGVRVRIDSTSNCGDCGNRCGAGQACNDGVCGRPPCGPRRAYCSDTGPCIDIQGDERNCGRCGEVCTTEQTCRDGACVDRCPSDVSWCSALGACRDLSRDVRHCGACGAACSTSHANSTLCVAGECQVTCSAGYTLCGGARGRCVDLLGDDREHCGACGHACEAGYICTTGACIPDEVRPIAPLSGTRLSSPRPWLRWERPAGFERVTVELCRRRDCSEVEASVLVTGPELRWPTDLGPGPHWWRARLGDGLDGVVGPTWEFFVPERGAPIPLVGATACDFNADGFVDAVDTLSAESCGDLGACIRVRYGHAEDAPEPAPLFIDADWAILRTNPYDPSHYYTLTANGPTCGDFDGDGFVDLPLRLHHREERRHGESDYDILKLYPGGPMGLTNLPVESRGWFAFSDWTDAGDLDADGYADLFLLAGTDYPRRHPGFAIAVFGRADLAAGAAATEFDSTADIPWGTTPPVAGDFNGDGIGDLALIRQPSDVAHALYVHLGARGDRTLHTTWVDACAGRALSAHLTDASALELASDLDGDGDADLSAWVGAPGASDRYTWSGGPAGLSADRCTVTPAAAP